MGLSGGQDRASSLCLMDRAWEAHTKDVGFLSSPKERTQAKPPFKLFLDPRNIVFSALSTIAGSHWGPGKVAYLSRWGFRLSHSRSLEERTEYVPDHPSCFLLCCHRKGHTAFVRSSRIRPIIPWLRI